MDPMLTGPLCRIPSDHTPGSPSSSPSVVVITAPTSSLPCLPHSPAFIPPHGVPQVMCQGLLLSLPAPQLLPMVLEASVHCHIVPGDKAGVLQGVLSPHTGGTLCPDWIRC